jgi:hypothetical protein
MHKKSVVKGPWWQELSFQVLLHAVVFIFYSYSRRSPGIESFEVAFFLNYALAAAIINYILLPRFLYRQKLWPFVWYLLLVIAVVIVIEEGVIEKIYFPDTRGRGFPGVFFNLLSAMPTITILVGFKFAWDALTRQRQLEELQSAVKESELQFLKTQINPHFLFNNLNNLYAHAIEQSPKTPEIILQLSAVLRYMLYETKSRYVPVAKEIEQLHNFINLSKLQFEGRGEVEFTAHDNGSGFEVAPLILPVFVENAFKHSASSQSSDIRIVVQVEVTDKGELQFSCINSFLPQTNTQSLTRGIGLENVKKRLQLLYPQKHTLQIDVLENEFRVNLNITLSEV